MIDFRTLDDIRIEEILDCFNLSFSDYLIPLQINHDQLLTKFKAENIDRSISIGAFRNDKLVGLVLHGKKKKEKLTVAYNGGTGVIPRERGQGLTIRMYTYILPKLQSNGIDNVTLEVISNNRAAIKAYEHIGFREARRLNCYKGEILSGSIQTETQIVLIENPNFKLLHDIGEIEPSWQNSNQALLNLGILSIIWVYTWAEYFVDTVP